MSIRDFFGYSPEQVSHAERLASGAGGFVGIFLIAVVSYYFTGFEGAAMIVPSMGASAVLVFAVPHGKLSQPWNVLGGNGISAVVGMTCYLYVPDVFLAAGLAVGIAITLMHYMSCIHPPGGASALAAVIGGDAIHALGYQYVLTPVLLNAFIIFLVAIGFNYLFPWRRYPASLMKSVSKGGPTQKQEYNIPRLSQDDLDYAMRKMDLLVDMTADDLVQLYSLASKYSETRHLQPEDIKLGHYYSNGLYGSLWQVRQIIDESPHEEPTRDKVIYKIVSGHNRYTTGTATREEFAYWARYEVEQQENDWVRAGGTIESDPTA
ncbi:HPP family protein [Thiohalophilus sp.]|uniref:HPP family protein n=1 Tax=Thiohalophilus sp. TaxID=3028392 RepID=UPI002ACE628D|nr:HPP family protein [Thiohalophilus sp.]MDZ7663608.1 HPP family protein [Thiohalophilus sp.]MDZ7803110.1 HPP family protein [Thiohalophilus sp.]